MISESKLLDRQILKNGDKSDQSLLWMLVLLLSFGLLMVYSASIAWAGDDGNPWKIVEKQAQFVALARFGLRQPGRAAIAAGAGQDGFQTACKPRQLLGQRALFRRRKQTGDAVAVFADFLRLAAA